MKKRVNKRFKLNNEDKQRLGKIFNIAGEEARISFIYAVCIIQTTCFIFFNKQVPIEKINKWFLKTYFTNEAKKGVINFNYMNIAQLFLKEKYLFDLKSNEQLLLDKVNFSEKQINKRKEPFKNLENYLEYLINKGLDQRTLDKIYYWVVK